MQDLMRSEATVAPRSATAKNAIRKVLFTLSGMDRIHIIGCSRSGTTMLHLAMIRFANVILSETETDTFYPYLSERFRLALRMGWRPGRKHYVTKREPGWSLPRKVDDLIEQTRFENIGLLHLVRDPRDVLVSRYIQGSQPAYRPYVTAEHWHASITAADRIFAALENHPRKHVLRYEDLVENPQRAEERIAAAFELRPNPKAFALDQVKDNFEHLQVRFNATTLKNLSGLRNMDGKSVGRWRKEEISPIIEAMKPQIRARFRAFCLEHGYD